MMYWSLLGILFIVCALLCAVGFYKFVYFLSVGYGLAIAGGGIAIFVMYLLNPSATPLWLMAAQSALFLVYGARLSGFLLVREFRSASFQKTNVAKDSLAKNNEKKMPIFVLFTIWLVVAALYVAQVSPMLFRYKNQSTDIMLPSIGMGISMLGLIIESMADRQKSSQKKNDRIWWLPRDFIKSSDARTTSARSLSGPVFLYQASARTPAGGSGLPRSLPTSPLFISCSTVRNVWKKGR